jgi:demethylmenaquinone methyltransferase/2-methoxy-6-polyprenyl-1,4-benzoquinol methylase
MKLNEKPLRQWSDQEKIAAVKQIFNEVTPYYDRMNHLLSARRDVAWRRFAIRRLPQHASRVLDIATGTGDVALDMVRLRPRLEVVGVDFVRKMLDRAVEKTRLQGAQERIRYLTADAMVLPFPDDQFDAATIAFGLRNIPDRPAAIREMARVVKPGGKVITVEMTFPRNLKMRRFFFWYLNRVIPLLGRFVAGNHDAYRYLSASIQDFIHPDVLSGIFAEAGLTQVRAFPLTLGITYLHEGVVP